MSVDRIDALSRSLADGASRRSILRLLGLGVAGTASTAVGLNDTLAKGTKGKHKAKSKGKKKGGNNPLENIALSGTAEDGSVVDASLDVRKFVEDNGEIIAIGKVTGTLQKGGKSHHFADGNVRVPVSIVDAGSSSVSAQAVCSVLHLELGPLDLTLLGLHVHLDQVVLDITANSNQGLLGQLLCSLAGGGLPLSQIVGLLNQILGILQGL